MGRVREAAAAVRETTEMMRARDALAASQAARDEILATRAGDIDIEKFRELKAAEHAALFNCELALQSLVGLVDHMAGDRS